MKTPLIIGGVVVVLFIIGIAMFYKSPATSTDTSAMPPQSGTVPTSADNAPPGSIHNLPVPAAVSAVRVHVAKELGISEGLVIVMTAFEKEWSDSCLGLGGPAEACLQVITPGYEVTVQVQGKESVYRTNADGTILRKQ